MNLSVTVRRQTDDRRNYRQIGQFQANGGHFEKMAATRKATLGSRADKWIIMGRTHEYSAHYVCNPPMGAAGPIVGTWSMTCLLCTSLTHIAHLPIPFLSLGKHTEPLYVLRAGVQSRLDS